MAQASIIIPCFNREQFIGETIESSLAQGPGVEVIIIDDGSVDKSWEIISRYPAVRSVRTENRGQSAARNLGISMAAAPFIRFHDSDDVIPPGAVASMLEVAKVVGPKQIAAGDAAIFGDGCNPYGGLAYGFGHLAPPGPIIAAVLFSRAMSTPLPLFPRKALIEVGGFDERLRISEDFELASRLFAAGYEFVRVPCVVCYVREHAVSRASRCTNRATYRQQLTVLATVLRTLRDAGVSDVEVPIARQAWTLGRDAARQRHRREANALFTFARTIAGRNAYTGHPLLRAAYEVIPPFAAERLTEFGKIFRMLGIALT